ncbi:alkaline phosphatase family protein [Paraburkholderia sp. Cy-641]|nr:alkaline phosphatase family protein [Paraburkholderia sp. Cy-641]
MRIDHPLRKQRHLMRTGATVCAFVLASVLAACSGSGNNTPSASNSTTPGNGQSATASTPSASTQANRVLVIGLDGATYNAVQAGIANGTLPNLSKLNIGLAYSGGMAATNNQTPNLDTPSWATLLTGNWAEKHQVYSDAPNSLIAGSTIFDTIKANGNGLNGAAVASSGLAQMLSPIHSDGNLDTLTDCSQNSSVAHCVTDGALALIGNASYATVVAQYHDAEDASENYGPNSTQYLSALQSLDANVGQLVAATQQNAGSQWLVIVTSGHGLSANGSDDGLPLEPESTAFIGMNQPANAAGASVGATVPPTLSGLYSYASIADVTPTILSFLGHAPSAANYLLDGAQLLGASPVTDLTATINSNNTSAVNVTLNWIAPSGEAITIYRNGTQIASLPAGTATYTDHGLGSYLVATGAYQLNYTVVAATAPTSLLTTSISYVVPVPLTVSTTGLQEYYPMGSANLNTTPETDYFNNSTLAPFKPDLIANGVNSAGTAYPDPFGGNALEVTPANVDAASYDGYLLAPNSPSLDVVNQAIQSAALTNAPTSTATGGAFTIGFWYKAPVCPDSGGVPIFGNKNGYATSGAEPGILLGSFGCGFDFVSSAQNSSTYRSDTKTSPGTSYSAGNWLYVAMVMNLNQYELDNAGDAGSAQILYLCDPAVSSTNCTKISTTVPAAVFTAGLLSGLNGVNSNTSEIGFGMGEDGTGLFAKNKGYAINAADYVPIAFSDVSMWTRALSQSEVQNLYQSKVPLSTLLSK